MTAAQDLILKLQDATLQQFWETPPEEPTFQDVLNQYATYYQKLNKEERKEEQAEISAVFWEQIKSIGTPIIEERADGQSEVYFLYRRDNLANIGDVENDVKKELYLQGDFHGYGSTLKSSQELTRLPGTDIMSRSNTMSKDALITYYYVQLDPKHGNKKATDFYGDLAYQPPSFFPDDTKVTIDEKKPPAKTVEELKEADELFNGPNSVLADELSKYRKGYDPKSSCFCADPAKEISHLNLGLQFDKDNPRLIENYLRELLKKARVNLVSKKGEIEEYPTNSNDLSEYSRSISVFAPPGDGEIDQVIIFNDGRFYQLCNTYERINELLSKNTAVIFISIEQGLENEAKDKGVNFETSDALSGMGVRTIDFKYKIDEYAEFIHKKLLPNLVSREIKIPDDPKKRVLIGASLSGTASMYMGLTYPEWFGKIVAQSPSIGNKTLLKDIIDKGTKPPPPEIFLSCGEYESPDYAKNLNVPFAEELETRLDIELHTYPHGHQMEGWSHQLEESLPALGLSIEASHALDRESSAKKETKKSELPSVSSQSIFSPPQESSANGDKHKKTDTKIFEDRKRGGY